MDVFILSVPATAKNIKKIKKMARRKKIQTKKETLLLEP